MPEEIVFENENLQIINGVPMENLKVNTLNPNVMDKRIYELLIANIKRYGYCEFIVTARDPKEPKKYLILNGEHRYHGLREEKKTETIIVNLKNLTPVGIFVASYSFNKIKGHLDPQKVANQMIEALKVFKEEDLVKWTSMPTEYIAEYTAMIREGGVTEEQLKQLRSGFESGGLPAFPFAAGGGKEATMALQKELSSTPIETKVFAVMLGLQDEEYVRRILAMFDNNLGVALVKICKKAEEAQKADLLV